ncbi:MAG: hypothetical protein ACLGHD_01175 [Actinomycetes bacterium]
MAVGALGATGGEQHRQRAGAPAPHRADEHERRERADSPGQQGLVEAVEREGGEQQADEGLRDALAAAGAAGASSRRATAVGHDAGCEARCSAI